MPKGVPGGELLDLTVTSESLDNGNYFFVELQCIIREAHQDLQWKVGIDGKSLRQVSPNSHRYIFDRVFDTSNSTQDVYEEFGKPLVLSAMEGINGTLLAYGQTSSGKTYTMMGDEQSEGVIPKSFKEIYDYIEKHPSRKFEIHISYMEIYNEDIKDLFNPSKKNIKIHENPQKQVYVGQLTEKVVSCVTDFSKHMAFGEKNRHRWATRMNDKSSRSHAIFRVHPSRKFEIHISYMEIYNEDIKDLFNPSKKNIKIHENPQKQV
ncbi:hypothetical protein OS493_022658 [Desmophyllum pertusum]|uniref:Kinesin motor domain-containing protein n=1 Tax=Desmophyllum pertusum TaxID=174260 RepID=A0A9X0CJY9_9CNID|nr:hypothetical protein OS493_022658 [Desmophyllum pertusum]